MLTQHSYGYESGQFDLGYDAFHKAREVLKMVKDSDDEMLALLYFYQCRLCCEMTRNEEACEAILLAREHLEEAGKSNVDLLKTTLYVRILSNLGISHTAINEFEKAEKYHLEAIKHCRKLGMEVESSLGNLLQNLGGTYLWSGQLDKAKAILDEALEAPNTNREAAEYTLGNWMIKAHRYDEAIKIHRGVLQVYIGQLGMNHPVTADSWHKLGCLMAMPEYSGQDLKEAE